MNRIKRFFKSGLTNRLKGLFPGVRREATSQSMGGSMAGTFTFVKFGTKMKDKQKKVREAFEKLENTLKNTLADGREKSKALTDVESAYVFASRAIRSEQIQRNARHR